MKFSFYFFYYNILSIIIESGKMLSLRKAVTPLICSVFLLMGLKANAQHIIPLVIQPTNPPGSPGPVTGPSSVLQNSTYNYSVTAATGATSYAWSLSPTNAGTAIGTTTTASIHWNSSFAGPAYVICAAVNNIGSTQGPVLYVQVTTPVTPLISGVISPALQNNSTPTTLTSTPPSGGNGIYSYQWQSSLNNSTWTPILYALTPSYSPSGQTASTYYRLVTTSGTASITSNMAFVNTMVSGSYSPSNSIVSVNESTGTANVIIPLYTIAAAHVTFPINLVYSATGLRTSDVEQNAGMGWQVSLGGAVTRKLRGLPDDVSKDGKGNGAFGWLYANNGPTISSLHFINDNNTATCADETTDLGVLAGAILGNTDTEPDIFQVNAPGLSCQLIFDNNNVLRVSPYQDLKVSYQTSAQGNSDAGQIVIFTITNDKGITYTFTQPSVVAQTAVIQQGPINYFASNYNHFKNGISYYGSWVLTQISDVHNNSINITYKPTPSVSFSNLVQLSTGGGALTSFWSMEGHSASQIPDSIYCTNTLGGAGQAFKINYITAPSSKNYCISSIVGIGHDFIFGYNGASSGDGFTRYFLGSIVDETCSAQTVNGQTVALSSYAPINLTFNYLHTQSGTTSLAGPSQNNVDYWGYTNSNTSNTSLLPSIDINPSTAGYERYRNRQAYPSPSSIYTYALNGANREADQNSAMGTLSQINYSEGGYTALSYEPNQYYDNTLQTNVPGGGIRVTQILDHDGISTDQDFIKSYIYRNLSNGISTGKALSLPTFVFTTPYSGTNTGPALWTSSTMVSPVDLSVEDHSILYAAVTETINNGGTTVYQFAIPATNWDTSVPVNPAWSPTGLPTWSQTTVDVGRPQGSGGSCQTEGVLRNDVNTYPFPPNINYDFERGLLTNVLKYNNTGTQVSEMDYYYQTPESPIDITGLKYDANSYATNYSLYTIHTSAGPLQSSVVSKVFDLTNVAAGAQPTAAQVITVNNAYNPAQHKLSQQSTINSDGSINTINIKYVKDYNVSTAADGYTTNLLALQNANMNVPVETYTQFTPVNGTQAVTTGADLSLFGTFPNQGANYLIRNVTNLSLSVVEAPGTALMQHLKFNSANGVTNFSPSIISNSNTFQFDNRYIVTENALGYDYTGLLLSKDDGFKHVKTTIYDNFNSFRLRAAITNARFDEIGLDCPISQAPFFHYVTSPNAYNFSVPNVTLSSVTRNGEPAMALSASYSASKIVSKNISAKNYIFSLWVNAAVAGSIAVTATDGTNTVTASAITFPVTVGNSAYPTGFKYCRVAIPVGTLTASPNITINFSSNQNINCTDIFTYPDVADVMLYSYDSNNNKIVETNGNGVSTYYSYDGLGRVLFVYDQDNNIIQRKSYVNNNPAINNTPSVNLSWNAPAPGYVINNEIVVFSSVITGNNTCTFNGNTLYTWNFGDGSTSKGSNLTTNAHDYVAAKGSKFTCTLTITSPENSMAPYSISTVVTL
ncbi:MAG: hypothetical protein ACHQIM_11500 [Sphingobacteriales bacterium]